MSKIFYVLGVFYSSVYTYYMYLLCVCRNISFDVHCEERHYSTAKISPPVLL